MGVRLAARAAVGASLCAAALLGSTGSAQAVTLNGPDLQFILTQIQRAEAHAAGGELAGTGPNQISSPQLPYGLRTVNGDFNNIVPGQERFGAADRLFPRLLAPFFRPGEAFDPDGPGPAPSGTQGYSATSGIVADSQPRVISNLIVDQTAANPAAVAAAGANPGSSPPEGPDGSFLIPNRAPDAGLSAPYNSWFTLFGQFFDHGLDLVSKGGSGTVIVPLKPDDPLYDSVPAENRFMVLTRATNQKGPDGTLGTADDVREHMNTTTPFVDQNQTYTSHPSHQVFLREFQTNGADRTVATGKLLERSDGGGLATWKDVKEQAVAKLGIELDDQDVLNLPLLSTDPYGRFIPDANGYARIVTGTGPPATFSSGTPAGPVDASLAVRTNHAFLDDIAHTAVPFGDLDGNPQTPGRGPLQPDPDADTGGTPPAGTYDDELLDRHFATGDGRGNENIGLTAVHHVFHQEHNLRVDDIVALIEQPGAPEPAEWQLPDGTYSGERLFQAARFVTEMEYQHLVFEEFARKVQPQVNLFAGYDADIDPAIVAEFAHTVYRFGHSMLTETVARTNEDGSANDVGLIEAFLNPQEFNDGGPAGPLSSRQAAGSVVRGMTRQVGNEIDEFVTGAVRSNLLGLPLDLATINLARGRDTGVPSLNAARRTFFAATSNSALQPYESWTDFKIGLKYPASVVNYVAAFGTHDSITTATTTADKRAAADLLVNGGAGAPADRVDFMNGDGTYASTPAGVTTTGVDDIDFWVGGLGERQMVFGGLLGSTFNFVFETQMEKLQDGDRLYYLSRNAGLNFLTQLEENSFSELINRTTGTKHLPMDVFSRPDFTFEVGNLGTAGAVPDDPGTPDYDESALLTRSSNGTIRFAGIEHVLFGGTESNDRITSSEGDDTLWGDGGDDRLEGGIGNDALVGGEGHDILLDAFGDDNIKGGPGDDTINAGPGIDLVLSGTGGDFVVAGADPKETFAGPGDDFVVAGDTSDTVFANEGDDWIEGGGQADLLQGDNGDPFQEGRTGDDVINGDGGNDDYDAEGGDDIMLTGTGTERHEGMIGFDWVTHKSDPQPANSDLRLTGLLPPDLDNIRDRFDFTEGLSGWNKNDTLRGDDADAATMGVDHQLTRPGLISGLSAVIGGATTFTGGNIILGGEGSDTIEGRGGNDVIDGDKWLNARISVRSATDPATEIRTVDTMGAVAPDLFSGAVKPSQLKVVREILSPANGTAVDTAVFSGPRADYDFTPNINRTQMTVVHARGTQLDGTDIVRNVERLTFADQTVLIAPVASLAPASLTFATRAVNTTSPTQNATLANTGTSPLTISGAALNGAHPADYQIASTTCGATLAAGAQCLYRVAFRPTAPGTRTSSLRVTHDSGNVAGSTSVTTLTGTGTAPIATLTPASRTFPPQPLNNTSAPQTATLQNTGIGTLAIASIAFVGPNAAEFARVPGGCGASLAANASCTITFTFRPTAVGSRTASLRVTSNSGGNAGTTRDMPVDGTGVNAPALSAAATQAFGTSQLPGLLSGGTVQNRTITFTSTGQLPAVITTATIGPAAAGSAPADYTVTGGTCQNTTRNVGATCTVVVRLRASATGARNATLILNSNSPVSPTRVNLTGTGTQPLL